MTQQRLKRILRVNLLFSLWLTLSLFHGQAFARPTPPPDPTCAYQLQAHLASQQAFSSSGNLRNALARRDSATLLLQIPENVSFARSASVEELSNFSTTIGPARYKVVMGRSADLLALDLDPAIRFQVIGSKSGTRSFALPYPKMLVDVPRADAQANEEIEKAIGLEKRNFGIFAADHLAFVVDKEDLTGVTNDLYGKLGIARVSSPGDGKITEWLRTSKLDAPIYASYRGRTLLSQSALHRLKTLTGRQLGAAPERDVRLSVKFTEMLAECEAEYCEVPLDEAQAVAATTPALAEAYPLIDQPKLSVDDMKELNKFLRENVPFSAYDSGVLPKVFVHLLDLVAPTEHATHLKLIQEIPWGQSDYLNGLRVVSAQKRILKAWRVLADRVLGTRMPSREVDIANIREVIAAYGNPAPAPAIEPTYDLSAQTITRQQWSWEHKSQDVFTNAQRPFTKITHNDRVEFMVVREDYARTLTEAELIEQTEAAAGQRISRHATHFLSQAMTDALNVDTIPINSTHAAYGVSRLNVLRGRGTPVFVELEGARALVLPLTAEPRIEQKPFVVRPLSITSDPKLRFRKFPHDSQNLKAFFEKYRRYAVPTGVQGEFELPYYSEVGRSDDMLYFTYDGQTNEVRLTGLQEIEKYDPIWNRIAIQHDFHQSVFLVPISRALRVNGRMYNKILVDGSIQAKTLIKHDLSPDTLFEVLALLREPTPDGRGFVEYVNKEGRRYKVALIVDADGELRLKTMFRKGK